MMRRCKFRFCQASDTVTSKFVGQSQPLSQSQKVIALENQLLDLSKRRRIREAENAIEQALKDGVKITNRGYNALIFELSKTGRAFCCKKYLWKMLKSNTSRPDVHTFSSTILAYSRLSRNLQSSGGAFSDRPINAVDDAIDIFNLMVKNEISPSNHSMNALLAVFGTNGKVDLANQYLDNWVEQGLLQPDKYTFSSLLHACSQNGDAESARMHLEKMKQLQIEPDVVLYQSILATYDKTGDAQSALSLLNQMIHEGVFPDSATFAAVIGSFARVGDLRGINKVWNKMEELGVRPNGAAFASMIFAQARKGKALKASNFLTQMINRKFTPHLSSFRPVIFACSCHGAWVGTVRWLGRLRRFGVFPDSQTYNYIFNSFCQNGDEDLWWDFVARNQRRGIDADVFSRPFRMGLIEAENRNLPRTKKNDRNDRDDSKVEQFDNF